MDSSTSGTATAVHTFAFNTTTSLTFQATVFPVYGAHACLRFLGEGGRMEGHACVSLQPFFKAVLSPISDVSRYLLYVEGYIKILRFYMIGTFAKQNNLQKTSIEDVKY